MSHSHKREKGAMSSTRKKFELISKLVSGIPYGNAFNYSSVLFFKMNFNELCLWIESIRPQLFIVSALQPKFGMFTEQHFDTNRPHHKEPE